MALSNLLILSFEVFDTKGHLLRQFGTRGKADGEIWYPAGVCIDKSGRIYVADHGNNRIQVRNFLQSSIALTDTLNFTLSACDCPLSVEFKHKFFGPNNHIWNIFKKFPKKLHASPCSRQQGREIVADIEQITQIAYDINRLRSVVSLSSNTIQTGFCYCYWTVTLLSHPAWVPVTLQSRIRECPGTRLVVFSIKNNVDSFHRLINERT